MSLTTGFGIYKLGGGSNKSYTLSNIVNDEFSLLENGNIVSTIDLSSYNVNIFNSNGIIGVNRSAVITDNLYFKTASNQNFILFDSVNKRLKINQISSNSILSVRNIDNNQDSLILELQSSNGTSLLRLKEKGLLENSSTGAIGNVLKYYSLSEQTTHNIHSNTRINHRFTPTVNGTGKSNSIDIKTIKAGDFNSYFNTSISTSSIIYGNGNISFRNIGGEFSAIHSGTGIINENVGLIANNQLSNTGTINHNIGIYIQNTQNISGSLIDNNYGIKIFQEVNTGGNVNRSYGVYIGNGLLGSVGNWGVYQTNSLLNNYFNGNVGIGINNPSSRLHIRGKGNTIATNSLLIENLSGQKKWVQNDEGQIASYVGGNAVISSSFGQFHTILNKSFGVGFYGNNCSNSIMTLQALGTTNTGLSIVFQNNPTSIIYGAIIKTNTLTPTTSYGVYGSSNNASNLAYGIYGTIESNGTSTSGKNIGVGGNTRPSIDFKHYAGYFTSSQNGNIDFANDTIALYSEALENTNKIVSGRVIGAMFSTKIEGSGTVNVRAIALNVPEISNLNTGNVVFGANQSTVNQSMLEVTGDIEVLKNGTINTGLILYDRLGSGARCRVYAEKNPSTGVWNLLIENA